MKLNIVIPKGRMLGQVQELLAETGLKIMGGERDYRPRATDERLAVKLLKSQNIPVLIAMGQHDCGFAGADWIEEQQADLVKVLDLGLDPVEIVACIPESWELEDLRRRSIIAVSEYRNLTTRFLQEQGFRFTFLQSYGATEVFPPEDADLIVDNSATGSTIQANRLKIVARLMKSSTQFIANRKALANPATARMIEDMALLFQAVLQARNRVLLEMNCAENDLRQVVAMLPAMKSPTICKLFEQDAYSVKAAVPRDAVRSLIPRLREAGASDILETPIRKVIP
jgi:ATP phosphoribosyltransferase